MTTHAARRPIVAVGFTGEEALRILDEPAILDRWLVSDAAFGVIGIDRIARNRHPDRPQQTPHPTDIDPSLVATAVAAAGGPPLVVAGAAHHDLPYNLARRVLSLDHLTHGRAGLLLGARDPRGNGETAWHGGTELGAATAADTALAIARLWQSWPLDSIVAEKDSGILVHSERINRVDHHGVVDIAGPLSVPTSLQGAPVLAWYADTDDLLTETPTVADLVVLGRFPDLAGAVGRVPENLTVLVEVLLGPDTASAVADALAAGADGVVLRSTGSADDSAGRLLDSAHAALGMPDTPIRAGGENTLRASLGLASPTPLLEGAPPAFAAPTTSVYR